MKKKKVDNLKNNNEINNWVYFSQSYLYLAQLACKEILNPCHKRDDKFRSSQYEESDIYISIIFNIKHGIEIFIKTLINIILGKLVESKGHDISKLFVVFREEFNKYKDNPKMEKTETEYDVSTEELLKTIEKLIKKYYYCEFIKSKMKKDFLIKDNKNTLFRYPNSDVEICINFEKLSEKINSSDIEEILEDTEILIDRFNCMGALLTSFESILKQDR